MATVLPFRAWHPTPEKVQRVSSVPYDVISTEEAREAAGDNPESFLHVTHPEVDLPTDTSLYDERVYEQGAGNLQKLMDNALLEQDQKASLYIYRLTWKGGSQTGVFGNVSVDEYQDEVILKHELTRPTKEKDRTRHILAQQAHAEPVMLTYKDISDVNDFITKECQNDEPYFEFTTDDGIGHTLWKVEDAEGLSQAFKAVNHLYIADGHHRCKSAANAAEHMRKRMSSYTGDEPFNYFPAVIFPMSETSILAYNRVIHNITDNFMELLQQKFVIDEGAGSTPAHKGDICLYFEDRWIKLTLTEPDNPSSIEKLDVYRLQKYILEPLLNIEDPRRDKNISFVGGIHGTSKLEKLVNSGKAELAISMFPTSIEELVKVSDEKGLMPPKSTWFEPKLRSGLLVHSFNTF